MCRRPDTLPPVSRNSVLPLRSRPNRRHLGRHYPATALFGVTELFDPAALVELVCTAVVPD
jgi:enamine deaminase RidA (YjgF/YER057c/UK114 family)